MWTLLFGVLLGIGQFGQSATGELRITVRDSVGLAVQCRVTLVSESNDVSQQLDTAGETRAICVLHLDYYLELAKHAARALFGREQRVWYERLEAD